MAVRRVFRESPIPGLIVAVVGAPDDGREYVEIEPDSPVKGLRAVWYSSHTHGHRWGYIVSEWPQAGEHIDRTWSIEDRARYWIEVVPDEDMPQYLQAEGDRERQVEATVFVSTDRAWLTPVDSIPAQRKA
jgi:hypothetical protein